MEKREFDKDDILGYEATHIAYAKSRKRRQDDIAIVNEKVHLKSGGWHSRKRVVRNFKRNFYMTKKNFQNHNDKKTVEKINRLQKFECTSAELPYRMAQALGKPSHNPRQKFLQFSPYIYGSDVTTPTLIKHRYQQRYPELHGKSDKNVAVLDIETEVNDHRYLDEPLSVSLTIKDKHYLFVTERFLKGETDADNLVALAYEEYMGETNKQRNSKLDFRVFKSPAQMLVEIFAVAHSLPIDFLAIYNMNFDIPKIEKCLLAENINPEDVYSDPLVPKEYRYYKYHIDKPRKETSTGKSMAKHVADLWHWVEAPSAFYIIDAMCSYKKSRVTKPSLTGYDLDTVLEKEIGIRKMKFSFADHLSGLDWHKFMQARYPIEYLIYNVWDCVSVEMLEEKNHDYTNGIFTNVQYSEYQKWGSNPSKLVDYMHFFALERNLVLGSASEELKTDIDDLVPSMNDWIAMLSSHQVVGMGVNAFADMPPMHSNVVTYVFDEDVAAAYPTGEDVMNAERSTSRMELCKIAKRSERIQRKTGIDMVSPRVNALEISHNMFKLPSLFEVLEHFCDTTGNRVSIDEDTAGEFKTMFRQQVLRRETLLELSETV